jgi:molecular chaperone GrpE (heat shock protein)
MLKENAIPNDPTSGDGEAVKDTPIATETVSPATEQDENKSGGNAEIAELKNQLSELTNRLQQQSAIIGKLTNEKKKEPETAPDKTDEKPKGKASEYSELSSQLQELQGKFQRQERAAKLSKIELALIEAGADQKLAKSQADYFLYSLGENLQAEETDNGYIVQVKDTDGTLLDSTEWAKAFIASDSGAYLRGTRTGPSTHNTGESRTPVQKQVLSSADYSRQYSEAHAKGEEAVKAFVATHSMK